MPGDNALCSSAALINSEYPAKFAANFPMKRRSRGREFKSTLLHTSVSGSADIAENLKEQERAIGEAIGALQKLESLGFGAMQAPTDFGTTTPREIQPDTFYGMSIAEAAKKYLGMSGKKTQTTDAITDALNRGGVSASRDSVGTILVRVANQDGDIVRVGRGLWGLFEWYPGRQRRAKKKTENGGTEESSKGAEKKKPENTAQVSFMITKAQRSKLEELGYTDDQIAKMKPAEAHSILNIGTKASA